MQVFEGDCSKLRDKWKEMQANHNILYHISNHIASYHTKQLLQIQDIKWREMQANFTLFHVTHRNIETVANSR